MTTYDAKGMPQFTTSDKIAATGDGLREDLNLISASASAAVGAEGGRAEAAANSYTDGQVATDRGRLTAIESKNTTQDGRLNAAESTLTALPNLYTPLSRGVLANGTDLNTLTGTAHIGDYSLLSTNTYPNAPTIAGAAVLEVRRGTGNTLSVVHRVTAGNVMVWREAVDTAGGSWSAWAQAETTAGTAASLAAAKAYADGQVATDRSRLTSVEAKNAAQDSTLSNHGTRVGALETLGGLAPGDVSDATVTDLIANPGSTTNTELGGQFVRKNQLVYNAADYLVGDGVADDTAALQSLAATVKTAKGTLYAPLWLNARITAEVDLRTIRSVDWRGTITVAHTTGVGVTAGHTSFTAEPSRLYFGRVAWASPGTQTNIALRLVGLKNAFVDVAACDYVQLYTNSALTTHSSISYSQFRLGNINKLHLFGEPGESWITECKFFGGRMKSLIIDGTDYTHNNLTFYSPCLESGVVDVLRGVRVKFLDVRTEYGAVINFGPNSTNCYFEDAHQVLYERRNTGAVINDLGAGNVVINWSDKSTVAQTILSIDASSKILDKCSEFVPRGAAGDKITPGLDLLKLAGAWNEHADTGLIPIRTEQAGYERRTIIRRFMFESDTVAWRPIVYVYDVNKALIHSQTTMSINTIDGWASNADGGHYVSSDKDVCNIVPNNPNAYYVRIIVRAGSSASGKTFRRARVTGWAEQAMDNYGIMVARKQSHGALAQTTQPTQGLVRAGEVVASATKGFICTSRVDTTLTVAAAASATTITVAATSVGAQAMAVGDVIGVLMDGGQTRWTTIAGIAGNVITLTGALTSPAAVGALVGTNKWAVL